MTARRVLAVCLLAAVMGSLVGCVGFYTQNRTVDIPSLKPASAAWTPPYWYKEGMDPHNLGEPFHFTDPRPRVLVIGHVQVLRDDSPSEAIGAILFEADDYGDNLTSLMELKSETVSFVSGDWFAGKIFTGKRRFYGIYIAEHRDFFDSYLGCGRRRIWAGVVGSGFRLNMDDATKAYYLGHITLYEKPHESLFDPGRIRVEVRDRADEFAGSIRAIVGDRGVEKALIPNCPK